MTGKILFIKNIRLTSLVIEVIGFVSSVPDGLLTLDLFAGNLSTKGNTPIFPDHVSLPSLSNLGLATATKNITFMMSFCSCKHDMVHPHLEEDNNFYFFVSYRTIFHLCAQHCTVPETLDHMKCYSLQAWTSKI